MLQRLACCAMMSANLKEHQMVEIGGALNYAAFLIILSWFCDSDTEMQESCLGSQKWLHTRKPVNHGGSWAISSFPCFGECYARDRRAQRRHRHGANRAPTLEASLPGLVGKDDSD